MFDHHIQQCIGYTNYDMNNISKQTDRISNKVQFASQRAICSRHFFMAVFGCLLLTPCFFLPAFYVHASTMQTSGMTNNSDLNAKAAGLVGWWTMDGANMVSNVKDSSGNGNNGNLVGFGATSSAVVAGKIGQALKFNGVNQDVVKSSFSPVIGTSDATVSAWVKLSATPSNKAGILKLQASSFLIAEVTPSRTLETEFSDGSCGFPNTSSNTILGLNKWYHVVFVYVRSGNASMYINGVKDASQLNISACTGSVTAAA